MNGYDIISDSSTMYLLLLLFINIGSSEPIINTVIENDPRRIVVIGDVHGAWNNFKQIAVNTQLIDETESWIANDTIFVQMGDLIHRREQNVEVVQKLFQYQSNAPNYNSQVCLIMGNHDYEHIKWNPVNAFAFNQAGSWYMPDYDTFEQLQLTNHLRELQLIYKINGFIFAHAGIEKKHLDIAQSTNIQQINGWMSAYFKDITFENQEHAQYSMERKIATAVWLQWYHDYKRQNTTYCDRVYEVLEALNAHTMIVGHYFPSSQVTITHDCDRSVIYSDIGIWYNHIDALIIENHTIRTLSGNIINPSIKYQSILNQKVADVKHEL